MELRLENGKVYQAPNKAAIARALRSLDDEDNTFAVLKKQEWYFMQMARNDDSSRQQPYYFLEYQDGSLDEHYQATDEPLTLDRIIDAFQRYAKGDESWREAFRWEKMDPREGMD